MQCPTCSGSGQSRHPQTKQFTMDPCPDCFGRGVQSEASRLTGGVTKTQTLRAEPAQRINANEPFRKGFKDIEAYVYDYSDIAGDPRLPAPMRAEAANLVTTIRLRALHGSPVLFADEASAGGRLEKAAEEYLDSVQQNQLNTLTEDPVGLPGASRTDTAAEVAQAQVRVTGVFRQSDARSQVDSLRTGDYQRFEPTSQQPQLNYRKELDADITRFKKELAEATHPLERDRIGQELTRANLARLHSAGR